MGKRGNGEGSIYQRESDGKWVGSVTLADGRRKVLYGKTRREVADKLAKALRDQQQGVLVVGPRQTVKQYLETWLETVAKPRVKEKTYEAYATALRCHLVPQLGKHRLDKLTPQDISAM